MNDISQDSAIANPTVIDVINPNSNTVVTAGLDTALNDLRFSNGPSIHCHTLEEGPFGIESQVDSDSVVMPLVHFIQSHPESSAFIIACYSDPGIDACRSVTNVPVIGIQEAGVLTAMSLGDRFGVLAIAKPSVERHRRYLRRMGVLNRLAGERPLELTVDESAQGENTFSRLVDVGRKLIDKDGADVLILGCAGMAVHRAPLEQELDRPVVEPTRAAVGMVMGRV